LVFQVGNFVPLSSVNWHQIHHLKPRRWNWWNIRHDHINGTIGPALAFFALLKMADLQPG
jgi:hypothetical protein